MLILSSDNHWFPFFLAYEMIFTIPPCPNLHTGRLSFELRSVRECHGTVVRQEVCKGWCGVQGLRCLWGPTSWTNRDVFSAKVVFRRHSWCACAPLALWVLLGWQTHLFDSPSLYFPLRRLPPPHRKFLTQLCLATVRHVPWLFCVVSTCFFQVVCGLSALYSTFLHNFSLHKWRLHSNIFTQLGFYVVFLVAQGNRSLTQYFPKHVICIFTVLLSQHLFARTHCSWHILFERKSWFSTRCLHARCSRSRTFAQLVI